MAKEYFEELNLQATELPADDRTVQKAQHVYNVLNAFDYVLEVIE